MARGQTIKFLRTTRAALNNAKTAANLNQGEPYLIVDEGKLAIGSGPTSYIDVATGGGGGGGTGFFDGGSAASSYEASQHIDAGGAA